MPSPPRIAYFPDSFHEVNGVAHTSRNFTAYARRHNIPMLCIRAGQTARLLAPDGSVEALELGRSPLAVHLEKDLSFDPLFFRYSDLISATVRAFRPDVIHITGPSELGLFGAYFAHQLNVPLVASWHTNLHEYAARRMRWLSRHLGRAGTHIERAVEASALHIATHLYRRAQVLYAPNPTLCTLLEREFRHADFPGVLHGEALATACADMDLLVFPSHTDTFGNVVLEALASGVPAIVTPDGGPAHILHSATPTCCDRCARTTVPGRIAIDEDFAAAIADVLTNPIAHAAMRQTARNYAQHCSWDAVFDKVLAAYPPALISHS